MRQAICLIFIAILFIAKTSAAKPNLWTKEVNFTSTDNQYEIRYLYSDVWAIPRFNPLFTGVFFRSIEAKGNSDPNQVNFTGNFMWGNIFVGSFNYPVSWLSFFSADSQGERYVDPNGDFDWLKFDVNTSSAFIASSYIRIEEHDPEGKVVGNPEYLRNWIWRLNTTESLRLSNKEAGLYVMSFEGNTLTPFSPLKAVLQYIITQKAGDLDLLGVKVLPRSIESFFIIEDWPYQSQENSLHLFIAIGTKHSTWNANGILSSSENVDLDDTVYMRLDKNVYVGNDLTKKGVSIHEHGEVSLDTGFSNQDLISQLNGKYGNKATCYLVSVEFPPGEDYIVYDPTIGSGSYPEPSSPDSDSQRTSLIIGLTILGIAIVVAIIVVVFVIIRKRRGYQSLDKPAR